ncbi:MAG: phage terminase family protein [Nitrospira sp.]|nr:phage terminase family protein [Nitrospira sp.]
MRAPKAAVQTSPLKFFSVLKWLDGRPLPDVMEEYRKQIHRESLFTFRPDGSPQFKRTLWGRAKKNSKTSDLVLAALYKLLVWQPAGGKGNQVFFIASDLGQANDDLDLTKKIIRCNAALADEVIIKSNTIERKDGKGFIEILPAGDAQGLHGKTYLFLVVDELHTQRDYRVLEALELDRTRPDAVQAFASYAAMSPAPGVPINDILRQHAAQSDPRLFVSWYSGTVEEANPSLKGPLGPALTDIEDAQRSLPSWIFRRLYCNLPGQPDGAAFDAEKVAAAVVKGCTVLPPQPHVSYLAFCDLSGGGADDATLAIAHHEQGQTILDCLIDQGTRSAGQTFDPQQTVERFAQVLKEYRCAIVRGDKYAAQWPVLAFQKVGITYQHAQQNRSELYAALEPLLNSGQVELLDHPKLLPQLIGLIRRGEKIDHASNEHDDHSNAAAGAVVLMAQLASLPPLQWLDVPIEVPSADEIQAAADAEHERRRSEGQQWLQDKILAAGGHFFPGD